MSEPENHTLHLLREDVQKVDRKIDALDRKVDTYHGVMRERVDSITQALAGEIAANRYINGDISTVMSPRTVITWSENADIFKDIGFAFRLTFLNKCDELERPIVAEFYQRCFGVELPESSVNVALS